MVQAGMRYEDVANQFGCSKLTITRLMNRVRQTGTELIVHEVVALEKRQIDRTAIFG